MNEKIKNQHDVDRKLAIMVMITFGTSLGAGWLSLAAKQKSRFQSPAMTRSVLSQTEFKEDSQGMTGQEGLGLEESPLFPVLVEPETKATDFGVVIREKKGVGSDAASLAEAARKAVSRLAEGLEENDPSLVDDLFGVDLQGMFFQKDFLDSFLSSPKISRAELIDGPAIVGDWSESVIRLILEGGSQEDYWVVFHLEDGEWKLFGTQETSS